MAEIKEAIIYGSNKWSDLKPLRLDDSDLQKVDWIKYYPEEYLMKAVIKDNRLLCKDCNISKCIINSPRIPTSSFDDINISKVICLGFASGILKKRTGIDFNLID